MIKFKWVLLLVVGCSYSDSQKSVDFTTIVVEESEIIIDAEINQEIAFPSFIRTASDYFLVYDGQLQRIIKFSYEGEHLLSFGRKGSGPGEFQSLTNYWIMDDHYLLYDYNGAKMVRYDLNGSFIEEYPVDIGELTMSIEGLSTHKFLYPANGEEGALLKVYNTKMDELVYIGEAVAVENESSNEEVRDIIKRGGVPNYMQNRVSIGANESGIFSFQNTSAILQKFSLDGVLLWERDLKIPSVDGVFENFLKEANEQDRYIPELNYSRGMHVYEYGAAVLINTPEDKPTTVVWVPNDGNNIRVVEYPDIDNSIFILRFRVAPEHNSIFFVYSFEGKVFRATWPIEVPD
jgi:hypothetical protein